MTDELANKPCVLCGAPLAASTTSLCPNCVTWVRASKALFQRLFGVPLH